MSRLLLLLALLVLSCMAYAQKADQKTQGAVFEPAVGSTEPSRSHVEKAMYPAAKAELERNVLSSQQVPVQSAATTSSTGTDANLAWGLLGFSFLVLCVEAVVVVKAQKPWSPQSILRMFGLTLIVPLAVLLIVAGYSENQISPVIGLLGVIAGYLLGNTDKPRGSG